MPVRNDSGLIWYTCWQRALAPPSFHTGHHVYNWSLLTYLSTVNQCHTHPSAPSYPSHNLLWQCDGSLAWTSTTHIDQCHAHSSTVTWHSIHPYWPVPHTFINHDPAPHTSICTFLNTYNGPTWTGSLVSPHESLLPWAQSAANGYIVEFCPLDGMGISSIFTEQCEGGVERISRPKKGFDFTQTTTKMQMKDTRESRRHLTHRRCGRPS